MFNENCLPDCLHCITDTGTHTSVALVVRSSFKNWKLGTKGIRYLFSMENITLRLVVA